MNTNNQHILYVNDLTESRASSSPALETINENEQLLNFDYEEKSSNLTDVYHSSARSTKEAEIFLENETSNVQTYESFEDMNLKPKLLRGIFGYGIDSPSTIQSKAIIPISSGKDVLAQAQSGTGKTLTFTVGILQRIDTSKSGCQAIIVAPTRELARQSEKVIKAVGDYMIDDHHKNDHQGGLGVYCSIGGNKVRTDIMALKSNKYQVVVGTPGRLFDMIKRKCINTNSLKMLILDEADQMLMSPDFKDMIHDIFKSIPEDVQACLLSATMPPEAIEITKYFMRDPIKILCQADEVTLEGIRQFYFDYEAERFKFQALLELYEVLNITQAVIFVNTRKTAEDLQFSLKEENHVVSCIHGSLEQDERNIIMQEFRTGASRILIATDLIARGIDVQGVSLVINYDLPTQKETYVHRIGRSGRFGRKGTAINFALDRDVRKIREIEEYYSTNIQVMPEDIADYV